MRSKETEIDNHMGYPGLRVESRSFPELGLGSFRISAELASGRLCMLKHFGTPLKFGRSPPRASFRISGRLGNSSGLHRNIASSLGTLFLILVLMLSSLGLIVQPEPISWLRNVSNGHQTGSASVRYLSRSF